MSCDDEEFPRRKKFYFGSPTNTPWNNDLFVKQASQTEQKYNDPKYKEKNVAIWLADQAKQANTPRINYDLLQPETARSTGSRTAKKISRSRGLRSVIRDELKDDIDSLNAEVKAAVQQRRKTNEKLTALVGLVEEIAKDRRTK